MEDPLDVLTWHTTKVVFQVEEECVHRQCRGGCVGDVGGFAAIVKPCCN